MVPTPIRYNQHCDKQKEPRHENVTILSQMSPVESLTIINGTRGQTVCTDATWIHVAKFIALNYITHAFTVLQAPGSDFARTTLRVLTCLFMPFLGMLRPLPAIARCSILRRKRWSPPDGYCTERKYG